MNERCPSCSLVFEREQGYFVGAMYLSYMLGVVVISVLLGIVWILRPAWTMEQALLLASVLSTPLMPAIFRSSRVLWLHFDHAFDEVS